MSTQNATTTTADATERELPKMPEHMNFSMISTPLNEDEQEKVKEIAEFNNAHPLTSVLRGLIETAELLQEAHIELQLVNGTICNTTGSTDPAVDHALTGIELMLPLLDTVYHPRAKHANERIDSLSTDFEAAPSSVLAGIFAADSEPNVKPSTAH